MGCRRRVKVWLGSLFLTVAIPAMTNAGIMYRDLGAQHIAGQWTHQTDNTYQILPSVLDLDVNLDSRPDLRLEHGYRSPFFSFEHQDGELLKTAHAGIMESLRTVQQLRPLAVTAAMAGVNDEDQFRQLQTETELALGHLERIANNWSYQGRKLLDGSVGVYGVSSDPNMAEVVRTTSQTQPGDYRVTVTAAAERAVVPAETDQTGLLDSDEILSINGTNIQLYAGMPQPLVVNRINEYSAQTGVVADVSGTTTRVYSRTWGSWGEVDIISNQFAAESTSGFGVTALNDAGADAEVSVGDAAFQSSGRRVSLLNGPAKGLAVRLQVASDNPTSTIPAGATFDVKVVDQSLDLLLVPNDSAGRIRIALPSVAPSGLGTGVLINPFGSLDEISVWSASQAQDSLQIIDAAVNELNEAELQLQLLLERYHQPTGQAWISPGSGPSGASLAIELAPLAEGQLVDANTVFSGEKWSPDRTQLELAGADSLFVGFRFSQDFATHYGWIRVGVDEENRLTLHDVAYESIPGRGIRIGYVPEPSSLSLAALGLLLTARHLGGSAARRRRP